jgi:pimeloyl-ACP methyl ester carboxylesterase
MTLSWFSTLAACRCKIAAELAKNHTLVIPDLRGYGDSGKHSAAAGREELATPHAFAASHAATELLAHSHRQAH